MKQPIRFFATGLLTATLLLFIIYLMVEKPQTDNQLTIDDMIKEVEDEGFHVLTKSEYITYSVEKDQNVAKQNEDENSDSDPEDHINGENKEKEAKEKNEEEKEKKETDKKEDKSSAKEKEDSKEYKYTLTIEENMLGPTISDLLVEHNIIDDATKFNRYLEDEGYARYIQIGDFKLSSKMSYKEIAETIAKKR